MKTPPLILIVTLSLLLTACGVKGPLYRDLKAEVTVIDDQK